MGLYTSLAQVWYPDETDTAEFNTLLATLASSIENGLQPRLALQEKAIGLKVSLNQNEWQIPGGNPSAVIPYRQTGTRGDFNQGFTFSGGTATVQTPGMYFMTASIGPAVDTSTGGKGIKIIAQKNGVQIAGSEVPGAVAWVGSPVTCVVNCVAGDTLRAIAGITNSATSAPNNDVSSHMSIAMVQAIPV